MGAEAAVGPVRDWDTWEELLLGGAVLRHGTRDWDVVVSELRARSLRPHSFTPEACKAKYEDLQKRYSGSKSWFEELRKRRVEELKRELERSEDSIGSLELKIKSLEAKIQSSSQDGYGSRKIELPLPALNIYGGVESSGKRIAKDESSAGSFTNDTQTMVTWSRDHPEKSTDMKPDVSDSSEQDKDLTFEKLADAGCGEGVTVRKRRGPRKRKNCHNTAKEGSGSMGESDYVGSSNIGSTPPQKEASITDCDHAVKDTCTNNHNGIPDERDAVMEIFESVAQSEPALVFRHRLDGQKRARYRRLIMQHVDMGTIRSRILEQSIKTAKELFRDLLLLANNALVFYSRRTKEHRSALALRHLVSQEYKKHCWGGGSCSEAAALFNPPVKPRSARPRPRLRPRSSEKWSDADNNGEALEQPCDSDDSVLLCSLLKAVKGVKRLPLKLNVDLPEIVAVKPRKGIGK